MSNQVTAEDFQESISKPDLIEETYKNKGLTLDKLADLDKEACEYEEPGEEGKKLKTPRAMQVRNNAIERVHKILGHYPAESHKIEAEVIEKHSPKDIADLRDIIRGLTEALRQNVKPNDDKG